jgi:hypothetical protein
VPLQEIRIYAAKLLIQLVEGRLLGVGHVEVGGTSRCSAAGRVAQDHHLLTPPAKAIAATDAPGTKHCRTNSALNDRSCWRRGGPEIPVTVFMGVHHLLLVHTMKGAHSSGQMLTSGQCQRKDGFVGLSR